MAKKKAAVAPVEKLQVTEEVEALVKELVESDHSLLNLLRYGLEHTQNERICNALQPHLPGLAPGEEGEEKAAG